MNPYIVKKKNLLIHFNVNNLVNVLIILFPISVIIGTAFVEVTALFLALYGLYILLVKKLFKINHFFFNFNFNLLVCQFVINIR